MQRTIQGETVCPSEDVLGVHQINVQPEDEDELHAESEPQNVRVRVEEVLVRVFYFESVPRAVHRGSPSNQHCARPTTQAGGMLKEILHNTAETLVKTSRKPIQ